MPDATYVSESRSHALDALLARRSVGMLTEPAPDEPELDLILDAGLRAPDHGRLRPWRFVVIRGANREAFAGVVADAAVRRDPVNGAAMGERFRAWVQRTPLVIAVGVVVRPGNIPEVEQLLSAGAAAMNILNAVHHLGYGAMWVTGANTYDPVVNAALGFEAPSRLVGLIAVGTPGDAAAPVAARPDRSAHVVEWRAPSA